MVRSTDKVSSWCLTLFDVWDILGLRCRLMQQCWAKVFREESCTGLGPLGSDEPLAQMAADAPRNPDFGGQPDRFWMSASGFFLSSQTWGPGYWKLQPAHGNSTADIKLGTMMMMMIMMMMLMMMVRVRVMMTTMMRMMNMMTMMMMMLVMIVMIMMMMIMMIMMNDDDDEWWWCWFWVWWWWWR